MSLVHRLQLLVVFQLLAYICHVFALPTPGSNETISVLETPFGKIKFQAEPTGRGTFGVIFSCTTTYIFCVWTAVHPNINPKVTAGSRLWYKSVLMFLSVVVPEGLLVCAFGQWREARTLNKAWQNKIKKSKKLKKKLGMDGAFFVVMGGFLVGTTTVETEVAEEYRPHGSESDPLISQPPPGEYTAILTPTGFLHYLELGYIDETSFDKSAITDKGKANNIAKLLASGQALWLIVQSLARWGSKLPITLLEIHVLIQVLCTTFIYFCWWSKPLDVDEPIEIKLKSPQNVAPPPNIEQLDQLIEEIKNSKTYKKNNLLVTKRPCPNSIAVKSKAFFDLVTYIYSEKTEGTPERGWKRWLRGGVISMVVEGTLVIVVGGLHLAAWKVHFPTTIESYLWIGSSIGMILFPSIIVLIASFTRYERDLSDILWDVYLDGKGHFELVWYSLVQIHRICDRHAGERKNGVDPKYLGLLLAHYILVYTCLLSLLMYALCTIYIVVESYISMRDPPEGVFMTPRWSDYWPHL